MGPAARPRRGSSLSGRQGGEHPPLRWRLARSCPPQTQELQLATYPPRHRLGVHGQRFRANRARCSRMRGPGMCVDGDSDCNRVRGWAVDATLAHAVSDACKRCTTYSVQDCKQQRGSEIPSDGRPKKYQPWWLRTTLQLTRAHRSSPPRGVIAEGRGCDNGRWRGVLRTPALKVVQVVHLAAVQVPGGAGDCPPRAGLHHPGRGREFHRGA